MPLGRRFTPLISPIGSGIAAICSHPSATVSITLGVSLSRSTIGEARPATCAAATSCAFACSSTTRAERSRRASSSNAVFLATVAARAISVAATRA